MGMIMLSCMCLNAQLVGSPSVDYTVDEVGTDFITITFTPNADAAGYAICLFEAGTAEQQFAMFGQWMGFQTMGDMIKAWGITKTEEYQHTWTNQAPGKDYEIYVQCWDVNNVDADMIIVPVTTKSLGGDGLAEMTIEIPKAAYETEEWGEENLLNYLKQDNSFDPYWDQFGVDEAQWNAEPATAYIAFSIGKNALGEWGPLASKEFRTPGSSAVNELMTGVPQLRVYGNTVSAIGMNAGSQVSVYDMNGRQVATARADAQGQAQIDLSSMGRGIYIVTDGETAHKFVK